MLDLPSLGRRNVFLLNPALLLAVLAAMLQPAIAGPQRMSNVFAAVVAIVLLVNAKILSFHRILSVVSARAAIGARSLT